MLKHYILQSSNAIPEKKKKKKKLASIERMSVQLEEIPTIDDYDIDCWLLKMCIYKQIIHV